MEIDRSRGAFPVCPFGEDLDDPGAPDGPGPIIGARIEEIFSLVLQRIKRSGYDGLLPAGMVLTGGTSLLPGIAGGTCQSEFLAGPGHMIGLIDSFTCQPTSTV